MIIFVFQRRSSDNSDVFLVICIVWKKLSANTHTLFTGFMGRYCLLGVHCRTILGRWASDRYLGWCCQHSVVSKMEIPTPLEILDVIGANSRWEYAKTYIGLDRQWHPRWSVCPCTQVWIIVSSGESEMGPTDWVNNCRGWSRVRRSQEWHCFV